MQPDSLGRLRFGAADISEGPAGMSRYLLSILNQLDREQFEVVLFEHARGPYRDFEPARHVVVSGEQASSGTAPVSEGANGHDPNIKRNAWRQFAPQSLKHWGGFLRDARRWRALFRRNPVDLLYVPIVSCEPAVVGARLAGVPCVIGTFHTDPSHGGWHERPLEIGTNHALDRGIAVSEAVRRDWIARTRMAPNRIVTIHNGIDPEHFRRTSSCADARRQLGLPIDRQVVAGLGCLWAVKGFSYLIESLALLRHEFPKAVVAIAGEGSLRSELEAKAVALGVADRVVFLGFRADVNLVYGAADVFVLSSLSEALPYVLLEAMSHELPTVATRVGGVPEIIVPGETGFLVPPGNSGAIAAALRPLLSSAELRQRMGNAGRQRVIRCFQEADMVRKTVEVYRSMLEHVRVRRVALLARPAPSGGRGKAPCPCAEKAQI